MGFLNNRKHEPDQAWLKLDNAAKIFPAISNSTRTSVFRLSVELKEPVHLQSLELAIRDALNDLPYFKSHLRKGFFWYWLEPSESVPVIYHDQPPACRAFEMQNRNHLLVRFLVRDHIISIEFSHILTDGGGGMQFLQRLLCAYGQLRHWSIPSNADVHLVKEQTPEILTDEYVKYFSRQYPKPSRISKAYHLSFPLTRHPKFSYTSAEISVTEILAIARSKKVTLTEYLASAYLFTLQKFFLQEMQTSTRRKKTILRVQIPVNLRTIFQSNTLRNFALFVMPEIAPKLGAYSFDEILNTVHHYMQLETDKRQIRRIITRNVGGEKNPLIRIIPLLIKVPVLAVIFNKAGPLLYSGVLTNLGPVRLPEEYNQYIKGFQFVAPPPDPRLKINAAMVSYGDRLILNIGSQVNTTEFEKEFFQFLTREKINLKILNH